MLFSASWLTTAITRPNGQRDGPLRICVGNLALVGLFLILQSSARRINASPAPKTAMIIRSHFSENRMQQSMKTPPYVFVASLAIGVFGNALVNFLWNSVGNSHILVRLTLGPLGDLTPRRNAAVARFQKRTAPAHEPAIPLTLRKKRRQRSNRSCSSAHFPAIWR